MPDVTFYGYECTECPFIISLAEEANRHEDITGHLVMVADR